MQVNSEHLNPLRAKVNHPVSGENPSLAASMFGWSSAVFIDLAVQAAQERIQ